MAGQGIGAAQAEGLTYGEMLATRPLVDIKSLANFMKNYTIDGGDATNWLYGETGINEEGKVFEKPGIINKIEDSSTPWWDFPLLLLSPFLTYAATKEGNIRLTGEILADTARYAGITQLATPPSMQLLSKLPLMYGGYGMVYGQAAPPKYYEELVKKTEQLSKKVDDLTDQLTESKEYIKQLKEYLSNSSTYPGMYV